MNNPFTQLRDRAGFELTKIKNREAAAFFALKHIHIYLVSNIQFPEEQVKFYRYIMPGLREEKGGAFNLDEPLPLEDIETNFSIDENGQWTVFLSVDYAPVNLKTFFRIGIDVSAKHVVTLKMASLETIDYYHDDQDGRRLAFGKMSSSLLQILDTSIASIGLPPNQQHGIPLRGTKLVSGV